MQQTQMFHETDKVFLSALLAFMWHAFSLPARACKGHTVDFHNPACSGRERCRIIGSSGLKGYTYLVC